MGRCRPLWHGGAKGSPTLSPCGFRIIRRRQHTWRRRQRWRPQDDTNVPRLGADLYILLFISFEKINASR